MVMKGIVKPGHVPVNNFELIIIGIPPIFFTEITGTEQETEAVDLPDRTKASGGNVKPTEVTAKMLLHHTIELAALELWRLEAIGNVTPTYKKIGNLINRSIENSIRSTRTYLGMWPMKRKDPDLDVKNEGDPAEIEWTFSIDDVLSI